MLFWIMLIATTVATPSTKRYLLDRRHAPKSRVGSVSRLSSVARIIRTDMKGCAVQGRLHHQLQHKGIVRIYLGNQTTEQEYCFGVKIGRRKVLTAAHCLFERPANRGSSGTPDPLNETFTVVGEHGRAKVFLSSQAHYHPRYKLQTKTPKVYRFDLAILDKSSGRKGEKVVCQIFANDTRCPRGNENCSLLLRDGYVKVWLSACSEYLGNNTFNMPDSNCFDDRMCIQRDSLRINGGDSGSPVFCQKSDHSGYYIAGLVSGKFDNNTKLAMIARTNWTVLDRFLQPTCKGNTSHTTKASSVG